MLPRPQPGSFEPPFTDPEPDCPEVAAVLLVFLQAEQGLPADVLDTLLDPVDPAGAAFCAVFAPLFGRRIRQVSLGHVGLPDPASSA